MADSNTTLNELADLLASLKRKKDVLYKAILKVEQEIRTVETTLEMLKEK